MRSLLVTTALLPLVCLAAEPSDLHRGPETRPVPEADARALVRSLADAELATTPAQLDALLRRPDQPDAVAARWRTGLAPLLGPDGSLGQHIMNAGIVHTQAGPAYTQVILGDAPLMAVRVREDASGRFIDAIVPTTCVLCPEEVRFVRDLIADVEKNGRDAHRLLPNVELDLTGWARAGGQRSGAMQTRNGAGEYLPSLLEGAQVTDASGSTVSLAYADGTSDVWTVRWDQGRWRVDYAALPDTSPLRLSESELNLWRSKKRAREMTLQSWSPRFISSLDGTGVMVAHRAVDAIIDPRDGTLWVLLLDLDRLLAGVAHVDPDAQEVLARFPLPISDAAPLEAQDWVSRWSLAASPDGSGLAVSTPTRLFRVDTGTGRAQLLDRTQRLAALSWDPVGISSIERTGQIEVRRDDGLMLFGVAGPDARWIQSDAEGSWVLQGDGTLVHAAGSTLTPVARACCGTAVDAALSPDGAELLVSCTPECDHAAAVLPLDGSAATPIAGIAGLSQVASWSPDGRWFTTSGASGDVLVWQHSPERVVATISGGPWLQASWTPDADKVLTVSAEGEVWLWEVAELRQELGR